jgi:hypothetical protein
MACGPRASSAAKVGSHHGLPLSSAKVEQFFPHLVPVIRRHPLQYSARGALNEKLAGLGEHRSGYFNAIERHHLRTECAAAALREYVAACRPDRLVPGSDEGSTPEQVAEAWCQIEREREAALRWAREKRVLQEVVQEYRFERRCGSFSMTAHEAAGRIVAKADATVATPLVWAGYIVEWAEREHRAWFWRCCRGHHVL